MKLLPRRRATEPLIAEELVADLEPSGSAVGPKGRPTPKRRDSAPRRAPIAAPPQTRREAMSWQRQQAKMAKANPKARSSSGAPARGTPEYRQAVRRGDPDVLPKRDRGPVRKLARDWVDSRRMISNYMLILFPLMLIGFQIQYINFAVLLIFIVIVVEWFLAGRSVVALAASRGIETKESAMSVGFYAGSRAYLPRKWRLPQPHVQRGDTI